MFIQALAKMKHDKEKLFLYDLTFFKSQFNFNYL